MDKWRLKGIELSQNSLKNRQDKIEWRQFFFWIKKSGWENLHPKFWFGTNGQYTPTSAIKRESLSLFLL